MMLKMRGHDTQNALPALGGISATMAIIWTQACNWDWEYAADPSNEPRIPEASIKKWMFLLKLNLVLLLQVLIKIPSLRNMVDAVIEELSLHWISTESIILLGLLFATAVAVILRHFYRVALLNETRAISHFAVAMCLLALYFFCTLSLAEWLGDYPEVYDFCGGRRTACRVHFLLWQNPFWWHE
jgi:hypothetical protein